MTITEQRTDWREITDTPWEPQPIAWRYKNITHRREALREQVRSQSTHLVREVLFADIDRTRRRIKPTYDSVVDGQERASAEFEHMRKLGLAVPHVEWHAFDDDGVIRGLARVPVIHGVMPRYYYTRGKIQLEHDINHGHSWERQLSKYIKSGLPGKRLCDVIHIRQWMYGRDTSSNDRHSQLDRLRLVDIEPVYDFG